MTSSTDADASNVSGGITSTETPGMNRRRFVAGGAGVVGLTGLAGCSGVLGSSNGSKKETVTWLLTPAENPQEIKKQYKPMVEYVADQVNGVNMEINVATDYSAIKPALKAGRTEIAFDDVTLISSSDLVDVLGTMVTEGTAHYFSNIVTKAEFPFKKLTDLKGETISFCDPISTSGSIYPLYALKQAGLNIGEAPTGNPTDFKGQWSSHDASLNSLLTRREVKANANSGKYVIPYLASNQLPMRVTNNSAYTETAGNKPNKLRALWWSKKIPKQPVIARADWQSDKRMEIRETMAKASRSKLKQHQRGDTLIQFSSIEKTSIEAYQPMIDRVKALGIDLR